MASSIDLECCVREVLARQGFARPHQDEARVVVFDSRAWADHAHAAPALLDMPEAQRAARFRFERDRTVYTLAHAIWRVALGVCLGTTATRVPLVPATSGQPQLPDTGLATSLSHSGPWVTLAVTGAATVGVDIERLPSHFTLDNLLPMFCTLAEAALLTSMAPSRRERHALALWTRKEALLKAWGTGLALEPRLFDACAGQVIAAPVGVDQPACVALDLDLGRGLVGALALPAGSPRQHHVNIASITPG